jgi:hypothetical protein
VITPEAKHLRAHNIHWHIHVGWCTNHVNDRTRHVRGNPRWILQDGTKKLRIVQHPQDFPLQRTFVTGIKRGQLPKVQVHITSQGKTPSSIFLPSSQLNNFVFPGIPERITHRHWMPHLWRIHSENKQTFTTTSTARGLQLDPNRTFIAHIWNDQRHIRKFLQY